MCNESENSKIEILVTCKKGHIVGRGVYYNFRANHDERPLMDKCTALDAHYNPRIRSMVIL